MDQVYDPLQLKSERFVLVLMSTKFIRRGDTVCTYNFKYVWQLARGETVATTTIRDVLTHGKWRYYHHVGPINEDGGSLDDICIIDNIM